MIDYVVQVCQRYHANQLRRSLAIVCLCAIFAIILLFSGVKEHTIPVSPVSPVSPVQEAVEDNKPA